MAPKDIRILGIKNVAYLSKGKRGVIYTASYNGKKVAIKTKNKDSFAVGRIENEFKTLKKLNKCGIGPKVLLFHKGKKDGSYMLYKFVEGEFILDYIEKNQNAKLVSSLLRKIFYQLYKMDKLGINKEEMHRPIKHIIISKNKPVMIDFEKAYATDNPHNVTQFMQFLTRKDCSLLLIKSGIKIELKNVISSAKKYKQSKSQKALNELLYALNIKST